MWKKTKDEYKKIKYSYLGDTIWKCWKTEQWILHIGKTGGITYHETLKEAKLSTDHASRAKRIRENLNRIDRLKAELKQKNY